MPTRNIFKPRLPFELEPETGHMAIVRRFKTCGTKLLFSFNIIRNMFLIINLIRHYSLITSIIITPLLMLVQQQFEKNLY